MHQKIHFSARIIDFGLIKSNKKDSNTKLNFMNAGTIFKANQTQLLKIDTTGSFSLAATIIETKKAGKMAKFWDTVFSASQEEIKTAAETAVKELEIFKTREQLERAKWKKQAAENTAKSQYYSALHWPPLRQKRWHNYAAPTLPRNQRLSKHKLNCLMQSTPQTLKKSKRRLMGHR